MSQPSGPRRRPGSRPGNGHRGTKLAAGVVTAGGCVHSLVVQPTRWEQGWRDVTGRLVGMGQRAVERAGLGPVAAAAIAGYRFGAGRGAATMPDLTVSTGIGDGAIVNRSPRHGAAGNAGESGHLTVRCGGRRRGCGRRGGVEAYASGTAIAERARGALSAGAASTLATLAAPTAGPGGLSGLSGSMRCTR